MKSPKSESWKTQNIVVTGATGHLGSAICHALAQQGASIIAVSSNEVRLSQLAREMQSDDITVRTFVCNMFDESSRNELIEKLLPLSPGISGLVNNAYAGDGGTVKTASCGDFRKSYEIGVVGPFHLTKGLMPALLKAKTPTFSPSVVNIASMYGHVSPDLSIYDSEKGSNPPFYGAAKAALLQLTRYCAVEFGPRGVRCNSVSPGPFPKQSVQNSEPHFIEKLNRKNPMGRIGQPSEVGSAVAFLLSGECGFMNGADMRVDGGWTAW